MPRANVAKTLLNNQHASFHSLNRRGDNFLFSIKSSLLDLSRFRISRPCKSHLAMIIIFMVGLGLSTKQALAS